MRNRQANGELQTQGREIQRQEARRHLPERSEAGAWYTPLVDIIETDEQFIFQADMPGVRPDDIDVSCENGVLTIDARVQGEPEESRDYLWREYGVGHFHRSFSLNTPIDVDHIRAELKNGELTLHVPKSEAARTRKIQIQAP